MAPHFVKQLAHMWPRQVFDLKDGSCVRSVRAAG